MARPVKKTPEQWRGEILASAQRLFLSKGYEETSITDIMEGVGGAKGMFYRFFQTKEEVMQALGDRMFFENNPFEAVMGREDLNGLEKIRTLLLLNQSDTERERLNLQALPILKDPRILEAAIQANRRVLTPLWYELLEEGRRDGSIRTQYARELSELLPLVNFWLMPSVYPATAEELAHKLRFILEALDKMGLPLMDDGLTALAQKHLSKISQQDNAGKEGRGI